MSPFTRPILGNVSIIREKIGRGMAVMSEAASARKKLCWKMSAQYRFASLFDPHGSSCCLIHSLLLPCGLAKRLMVTRNRSFGILQSVVNDFL